MGYADKIYYQTHELALISSIEEKGFIFHQTKFVRKDDGRSATCYLEWRTTESSYSGWKASPQKRMYLNVKMEGHRYGNNGKRFWIHKTKGLDVHSVCEYIVAEFNSAIKRQDIRQAEETTRNSFVEKYNLLEHTSAITVCGTTRTTFNMTLDNDQATKLLDFMEQNGMLKKYQPSNKP